MPLAKQIVLTYEGLEKLEKELEHLKTVGRKEIAEKIKQALSFGDLSENSEYDEAKNEQAQMETRIVKIEKMLKNAKVIDEEDVSTDVVSLGSKVTILDIQMQEEIEYIIVGSAEANPMELKISDESPVGSALIGKKVGDVVEATVPAGTLEFKIIKISK
ncbi:MAG: transcription elongation factor GreA [Clostridiaceae bacterium]|jgi:transcription elongation factor GreA|nr:transcription elongation factor GreA [Clostridiaceae bacterium]